MLEKLKGLDLQTPTLDELIYLSSQAKALRAEFDANNAEVPEWLDNRIRELKREIQSRLQDSVALRIKTLKAQRDALKTPQEKREAIEAELQKLEAATAGA